MIKSVKQLPTAHLLLLPLPQMPNGKDILIHAYCFKCRVKSVIEDPKNFTMDNMRKAITGKCPKCGMKVITTG